MEIKEVLNKLELKFKENLKEAVTGNNVDFFIECIKIFQKTEKEILSELCVD